MHVFQKKNRDIAMREAIKRLNGFLRIANSRPLLLMLSSGSALELLAGINMRYIGKHVTLSVLDERFSRDPAVNNFGQLEATEFYRKAEKKGVDYINTSVRSGDTLRTLSGRFEKRLRKWRKANPSGMIIVTQGIGEDGHTAGIMPFPENREKFKRFFEDSRQWVKGYNATRSKTEYPLRITVTFPFLRDLVDYSVVYVTGKTKLRAIKRVLSKQGALERTPARVVREMSDAYVYSGQ